MMAWMTASACAGLVFLAMAATSTTIAGVEEISSPLRVAQCRANCLQKFASGPDRGTLCLQGPDCFMCWENCELLQSNFAVWGELCSEKGICFPGCQQACRFHREAGKLHQSQPVIHTRGDEVIQVTGTTASWPRAPTTGPDTPLVYVVVSRAPGSPAWRQLVQTVELTTKLSDPTATTRVLVVDPAGLVTIYSPVPPPSSPLADVLAGLGMKSAAAAVATMQGQQRKKINTEIVPSTSMSYTTKNGDWRLHQVSLIHQKVLVIAEVTWQPRAPRAVYLVTWEVDGGGLKGNLFTDSTSVTLSLWPDTVYHIQVELVSRATDQQVDRSSSLMIDTHRAEQVAIEASFLAAAALDKRRPTSTPPPSSPFTGRLPAEDLTVEYPPTPQYHPHANLHPGMSSPLLSVLVKRSDVPDSAGSRQKMQVLAGAGAALLLAVVVAAAGVAWRWRRARYGTARVGPTAIRPAKLVEDVDARKQRDELAASFLKAAERSARNEVQV